jgi:hypothetical protein
MALSLASLLLINKTLRTSRIGNIFQILVEFLFFFVVIAGFFFPVSVSGGMIDPRDFPVNQTNLLLALSISVFLAYLASGTHRGALYTGVFIFVLLNTTVSVHQLLFSERNYSNQKAITALHNISSEKNIFVVSFDGLSGSATRDVLSQDLPLSKDLAGFRVFDHVATSSPATSASTAASLYGNTNFKAFYSSINQLWDSSPTDLLTNYLQNSGWHVSTYGAYGMNFSVSDRRIKSASLNSVTAVELINYTIARIFTSKFLLSRDRAEKFEKYLVGIEIVKPGSDLTLQEKISISNSPWWKSDLATTMIDFRRYLSDLRVGTTKPVAHFLHFTFTHFPVEFDRNCNFLGHETEWFESRQNRFGVEEESVCALKKFSELIEKLKSLNVYKKSMIIFKSDHGSFEASANRIDWNLSPVMIDDLARTVCVAALDEPHCYQYPGYDLMDGELMIPEDATATVFIPASNTSTFEYDTHISVSVKRHPDIVQNLYEKLSLH